MATANKVAVGKPAVGGAVSRAAVGATLPTDTTTALTGFVNLGYISDAGLTNNNTPESDSIKAWGGDTVYSYQTSKDDTFTFTLIECLNEDVLKAVYGDANVTGTVAAGLTVKANSKEQESASWVVDVIIRGAVKRIVIPSAKITNIGEITYSDDSAVGYEVTLTAEPDAAGNTHYEYIKG